AALQKKDIQAVKKLWIESYRASYEEMVKKGRLYSSSNPRTESGASMPRQELGIDPEPAEGSRSPAKGPEGSRLASPETTARSNDNTTSLAATPGDKALAMMTDAPTAGVFTADAFAGAMENTGAAKVGSVAIVCFHGNEYFSVDTDNMITLATQAQIDRFKAQVGTIEPLEAVETLRQEIADLREQNQDTRDMVLAASISRNVNIINARLNFDEEFIKVAGRRSGWDKLDPKRKDAIREIVRNDLKEELMLPEEPAVAASIAPVPAVAPAEPATPVLPVVEISEPAVEKPQRWNITQEGFVMLATGTFFIGLAVTVAVLVITAVNYIFGFNILHLRGAVSAMTMIVAVFVPLRMLFIMPNSQQKEKAAYNIIAPFKKATDERSGQYAFVENGRLFADKQALSHVSEMNQLFLYIHELVHMTLRIDDMSRFNEYGRRRIEKLVELIAYAAMPLFLTLAYIGPYIIAGFIIGCAGWSALAVGLASTAGLWFMLRHHVISGAREHLKTETPALDSGIKTIKENMESGNYPEARSGIMKLFIDHSKRYLAAVRRVRTLPDDAMSDGVERLYNFSILFETWLAAGKAVSLEDFNSYTTAVYVLLKVINKNTPLSLNLPGARQIFWDILTLYMLNRAVNVFEDNPRADAKSIDAIYAAMLKPFRASTSDIPILGRMPQEPPFIVFIGQKWAMYMRKMFLRALHINIRLRPLRGLYMAAVLLIGVPLYLLISIPALLVMFSIRGKDMAIMDRALLQNKALCYEVINSYLARGNVIDPGTLEGIAKMSGEDQETGEKADHRGFAALVSCVLLYKFGYSMPEFFQETEDLKFPEADVNIALHGDIQEDGLAMMEESCSHEGAHLMLILDKSWLVFKKVDGKTLPRAKQALLFRGGKPVFVSFVKPRPIYYFADFGDGLGSKVRRLGVPMPGNPIIDDYTEEKDVTNIILDSSGVRIPKTISLIVEDHKDVRIRKWRKGAPNVIRVNRTGIAEPHNRKKIKDRLTGFLADNGFSSGVIKPNRGLGGEGVVFFDPLGQATLVKDGVETVRPVEDIVTEMLGVGTNVIVQERIEPPLVNKVNESGQADLCDWNLRVFISRDEKNNPIMSDIVVRVGKVGGPINISKGAGVVTFDELVILLQQNGLVFDVAKFKAEVEKISIDAYNSVEKAMISDGAMKQGEIGTDFMGADVIVRIGKDGQPVPYILEVNDYHSGSMWDIDDHLKKSGVRAREAAAGIKAGEGSVGRSSRDWIKTMIRRAGVFKASVKSVKAPGAGPAGTQARGGGAMIPLLRYALGEEAAYKYQALIEQVVGWAATIGLKFGITAAFTCAPAASSIAAVAIVWGFFIFAHTDTFIVLIIRACISLGLYPVGILSIPRAPPSLIINAGIIALLNVIAIGIPISFPLTGSVLNTLIYGAIGTYLIHQLANTRFLNRGKLSKIARDSIEKKIRMIAREKGPEPKKVTILQFPDPKFDNFMMFEVMADDISAAFVRYYVERTHDGKDRIVILNQNTAADYQKNGLMRLIQAELFNSLGVDTVLYLNATEEYGIKFVRSLTDEEYGSRLLFEIWERPDYLRNMVGVIDKDSVAEIVRDAHNAVPGSPERAEMDEKFRAAWAGLSCVQLIPGRNAKLAEGIKEKIDEAIALTNQIQSEVMFGFKYTQGLEGEDGNIMITDMLIPDMSSVYHFGEGREWDIAISPEAVITPGFGNRLVDGEFRGGHTHRAGSGLRMRGPTMADIMNCDDAGQMIVCEDGRMMLYKTGQSLKEYLDVMKTMPADDRIRWALLNYLTFFSYAQAAPEYHAVMRKSGVEDALFEMESLLRGGETLDIDKFNEIKGRVEGSMKEIAEDMKLQESLYIWVATTEYFRKIKDGMSVDEALAKIRAIFAEKTAARLKKSALSAKPTMLSGLWSDEEGGIRLPGLPGKARELESRREVSPAGHSPKISRPADLSRKWKEPRRLELSVSAGPFPDEHIVLPDLHCVPVSEVERVLKHAGFLNETGGIVPNKTLVQMGDIIDRGAAAAAIALNEYFRRLQAEARRVNSNVIRLIGDHEEMLYRGMEGDNHELSLWAQNLANEGDETGRRWWKEIVDGLAGDTYTAKCAALRDEIRNGEYGALYAMIKEDIEGGFIRAAYSYRGVLFIHGRTGKEFAGEFNADDAEGVFSSEFAQGSFGRGLH
ncbi:MAG: hypothetical protein PHT32_04615, partial [Candidatus Omnitrophica bacterium]|nr:hypothetical protein [Candidatus Omnitrophota bacterium]